MDLMFDFEHPFARNGLPTLGSGTKDQVLLTTRKSYSSCMAISHFLASSSFNAFSTVWGSFEKAMVARSTSFDVLPSS
jgi:hypothetical protein